MTESLAVNYARLANHAVAAAILADREGRHALARSWRAHARYLRARSRTLAGGEA